MRPLVFQCPVTGLKVQGMIAEDLEGPNTIFVPVDCTICNRPHLINATTGRTAGNGEKAIK